MFIANAGNDIQALCLRMMFTHGCTVSDIRNLKWRHINFKHSRIKFFKPKRVHSLDESELSILRLIAKNKTAMSDFVFATQNVKVKVSTPTIHRWLNAAGIRAGLVHLRPHPRMLRHSKGLALAMEGFDYLHIQKYLGFRTADAARKYTEFVAAKPRWKKIRDMVDATFRLEYGSMDNSIAAAQEKIIAAEIKREAIGAGITDSDLSIAIPRSGVTVDADFNVYGAREAVGQYKEDKPALFKSFKSSHESKPEFKTSAKDYMDTLKRGSPEHAKAKENFIKYGDPRRTKANAPVLPKPPAATVTPSPGQASQEFKRGTPEYEKRKREFIRQGR